MVEKKKKKKDNVRKPVGDTPTAQQKLENLKNPFYKAPFSFPKSKGLPKTKPFSFPKSKGLPKTKPFSFPKSKGLPERKIPVDKDGNPLSLRQREDRLRKSPRKFESGGMVGRRGKSRK
jgi:hypothetical protein